AAAQAQGVADLPKPAREAEWLEHNRRVAEDAFEATQADPKELARVKLAVARDGFELLMRAYWSGRGAIGQLDISAWSGRVLRAEQTTALTPNVRLADLEGHWLWAVLVERHAQAVYESGKVPFGEVLAAKLNRIDAEIA